ncbi:epoxide hydrolase family protein [Dyella flava]|uniref:Epoxide hydrolase n=1 Tax=Dyella flava TaxID=1920170 RepID=A0ABS2JZT8_9GAMM|nr:epoxide hydrolase family protein [Dyella flava]MBM7124517.1 epoxide hydrolase [Dyella flava]GLQ51815.1 multidrug MFS transporter [Dyella flava]
MLRRQFLSRLGGALALFGANSLRARTLLNESAADGKATMTGSNITPGDSSGIQFDITLRQDLLRRLSATRWNDAVSDDWRYGMNESFLKALIQYWCTTYDFDAAEKRLNELPHQRAEIQGFGISYIHLRGRGPHPKPLLLMNGWPSSFAEYRMLAPRLADPAAFGGSADDAFDVVIPTLPGFGLSERPTRPYQVITEDLFHRLMTEKLGYRGYIASGTDIGAGVATRLALKYPASVKGIHVSTVVDMPLPANARPLTDAEKAYQADLAKWEVDEGAYEHLQSTRPQTLAFGLADSPAGLASWIVEKFYFWSDNGGDLLKAFPMDVLIDNVMIYWATGTIGSSVRYYYDSRHYRQPLKATDHVTVPTAVSMWPKDLVKAPREWAERFYNVQQYSMQAHGGHFPAWEAPDAYAQELRQFAKSIRV